MIGYGLDVDSPRPNNPQSVDAFEPPSDAVTIGAFEALGEARQDAEIAEEAAALQHERARTLADVASALMQSGDRVDVATRWTSYAGLVVHADGDLATIELAGGELVDFDPRRVTISVVGRSPWGGSAPQRGAVGSIWARLLELEIEAVEVSVEIDSRPDHVVGRVGVVGRDHVIVATSACDVVVPLDLVVVVIHTPGVAG